MSPIPIPDGTSQEDIDSTPFYVDVTNPDITFAAIGIMTTPNEYLKLESYTKDIHDSYKWVQ